MEPCALCTGSVTVNPAGKAKHFQKCRKARPYEREFFAQHNRWPRRTDKRIALQIQSGTRSHQRSVAEYHLAQTA